MKTLYTYILAAFFTSLVLALQAEPRLDSLQRVVVDQTGRDRIVTLNQLVYEYALLNLETAKKYADEAYAMALHLEDEELRLETMIFYSMALSTAAQFDEAYETLQMVVERSQIKDYQRLLADAYNQIARNYYFQENLTKAWEYIDKSAQIRFTLGDEQLVAASYNNFGLIEIRQGNYELALEYLEKAYQTYQAVGAIDRAASIQNNRGNIFFMRKEFEEALSSLLEAKEAFEQIGNNYQIAAVYENLALVYIEFQEFDLALDYAQNSLSMRRQQENLNRMLSSLRTLAKVLYTSGRVEEALPYLKEAEQSLDRSIGTELNYEVTLLLGKVSAALGNAEAAFAYMEEALLLKDAVDLANQQKALNELKVKLEIERYQADIANLEDLSASQQKSIVLLSILVFVVFSFLASLIWIGYRLKKAKTKAEQLNEELSQSHQLIANQNIRLQDLSDEKDYFLRIVAHDIGNQLANIHGLVQLIQMESSRVEAGGNPNPYLKRLNQITNNLILMVRKVLDVRNLEQATLSLDLKTFDAVEIVNEVVESYTESAAQKQINLKFLTKPHRLKMTSDKQLLAQCVDNLVSNALKFSPLGETIEVLLEEKNNQLVIMVNDNGPGISGTDKEKLFNKYQRLSAIPTGGESSTGLGLSIVKRYVELMGGQIVHENRATKGCCFTLSIPLQKEALIAS